MIRSEQANEAEVSRVTGGTSTLQVLMGCSGQGQILLPVPSGPLGQIRGLLMGLLSSHTNGSMGEKS